MGFRIYYVVDQNTKMVKERIEDGYIVPGYLGLLSWGNEDSIIPG